MASAGVQLRTLLWKNAKVQLRSKWATVFELCVPVMFTLLLVFVRQVVKVNNYVDGKAYLPYSLEFVPYWPNGIAFAPNTPRNQAVMLRAAQMLESCDIYANDNCTTRLPFFTQGFANEQELESNLTESFTNDPSTSNRMLGGVSFLTDIGKDMPIRYKIRMASTTRNQLYQQQKSNRYEVFNNIVGWQTGVTYPLTQGIGPREADDIFGGAPGYFTEGFLQMQHAIDMAITEVVSEKPNATNSIATLLWRYSYPPYTFDKFVLVIQMQLPIVIMLGYVLAVLSVTRNIVLEKEKRLKEFMKVMGLNNWLHWVTHFIWNICFLTLPVIFLTVMLCAPFGAEKILRFADASFVFFCLLVYTVAMICYCFAISTFFRKGNQAAASAGVLWFMLYMPYFFLQSNYGSMSFVEKLASCLSVNTGMAMGLQIIGMWEAKGESSGWGNAGTVASLEDNFTMLNVIAMLLFDSLICLLVAFYVEAVYPGDDGPAQPLWFPLKLSYWFPKAGRHFKKQSIKPVNLEESTVSNDVDTSCFEEEPRSLDAVIQIRNLFKIYGKKTAVDGISMNMYRNQVTALLGHNGAGKTTTMSMLTGLLNPSKGTAVIDGHDIRTDMEQVQKMLGLCPQYNVLFDGLTVWEHLVFFARLKGCQSVEADAESMLRSLKMMSKRDALSSTLSGGMKRKLSVGIALIGGSQVIILDEPTAGMDPGARRSTWELLQRERAGRSMVLTTHYMEEADLLGDRIAIMADGQVRCCGGSLFLKNRYGAGYHLTVVFHPNQQDKQSHLEETITSIVPHAHLDTAAGSEVTYTLPHDSAPKFERLFTEIEAKQHAYGVASFGASVTTMEEVFLRVGEQRVEQLESAKLETEPAAETGIASTVDLTGFKLINPPRHSGPVRVFHQFIAMMIKRIMHTVRNWKVFLPQVVLPGILLALMLSVQHLVSYSGSSSARFQLPLNLEPFAKYGSPMVSFLYNDTIAFQKSSPIDVKKLKEAYKGQFGSSVVATDVHKVLAEPPWSDYASTKYGDSFRSDIVGILTYERSVAEKDVNLYNVDHIIGSYAQNGDVADTYIKLMTNLHEKQVLTDSQWKQFHDQGIPYLQGISDKFGKTANVSLVGLFNNQAYHTPGVSLNAIDNAVFRSFSGGNGHIETINHPLPSTASDKVAQFENASITGFNMGFTLAMGLAFLAATFVLFLIKERVSKAKHLQYICGINPINFWLATFIWDLVNFVPSVVIIISVMAAFDEQPYVGNGRFMMMFYFLMVYACAILPFMYLASFMYDNATVGFVKMTIWNIVLGAGPLITVAVMEIPQLNLGKTEKILKAVFTVLFPQYCVAQGIRDIYSNYLAAETCGPLLATDGFCAKVQSPCCPGGANGLEYVFYENYLEFDRPGAGSYLLAMAIQPVIYFAMLLLHELDYLQFLEYKLRSKHEFNHEDDYDEEEEEELNEDTTNNGYPRNLSYQSLQSRLEGGSVDPRSSQISLSTLGDADQAQPAFRYSRGRRQLLSDDPDVEHEERMVAKYSPQELFSNGSVVTMKDLTKYYGNNRAVNRLSLCIKQEECFGLLGVNGAGKTTTFKMLTGDIDISEGDAHIAGHSVKGDVKRARESVGYCPQFDGLIEQMTGFEMIQMFARLRGIPDRYIKSIADQLITVLALQPHRDKMTKDYSGGNRRKLSIALSLVGSPPVIMLDEPTAGIDPVARRLVWRLLAAVRECGTPLMLTSHSMDECEALCTRLAIMVDGQFKCLGSPQHLKTKFGTGYTVLLKVTRQRRVHNATTAIKHLLPGTRVKDIHQTQIHLHVPSVGVPYSRVFSAIERHKAKLRVVDYSVSQTTLEQIFLNFSRGQRARASASTRQKEKKVKKLEKKERRNSSSKRSSSPKKLTRYSTKNDTTVRRY